MTDNNMDDRINMMRRDYELHRMTIKNICEKYNLNKYQFNILARENNFIKPPNKGVYTKVKVDKRKKENKGLRLTANDNEKLYYFSGCHHLLRVVGDIEENTNCLHCDEVGKAVEVVPELDEIY